MSTDIDDVVIAQEQREQLNDLLVQLFDAPATDLASIDEKEFPCWLRGFAAGYNSGLKRGAAEEREANGPVGPGTVQFSTSNNTDAIAQFQEHLSTVAPDKFIETLRWYVKGWDAGARVPAIDAEELQFSNAMSSDSLIPPSRREMTAAEARRLVDQSERAKKNRNFEPPDPLLG